MPTPQEVIEQKEREVREADKQVALTETLPDYLAGYKGPTGTEGIEDEDVTIPRLKIGQSMSDEVKSGAIKEGALYINVTGQAVWSPGEPPLEALIIAQSKEYILWKDPNDGGGVLARARAEPTPSGRGVRYRWDKPNQTFENKVGGKTKVTWEIKTYVDENNIAEWGSEIPGNKDSGIAATGHHNYLLLLPTKGNIVVAASLSKSAAKVAKDLNAQLKMADPRFPVPVRLWRISTVSETNNAGNEYKNWKFEPAGILQNEQGATALLALKMAKNYIEADYVVDQSDAKTATDHKTDDMKDEIPF